MKNSTARFRVLKAILSSQAAVLGFAAPAFAQEADQTGGGLDEIVVTARRTSENLQSVPVAVTALTAEALERNDVRALVDVDRFTPGLILEQGVGVNGGSIGQSISVRGIGQRLAQPEADPAVGIYLDNVYLGRVVGSVLSVVDAERVEVLRGPQGTLYGKNTLAGAINIVSQLPDGDFRGYVDVGAGDYDERNLRAAVEFPMVDNILSGRLSVAHLEHEGYDANVTTGDDMGSLETDAARAVLNWTPTNNLRVTVIGDYTHEDNTGQGTQVLSLRAPADGGSYITANYPALVPTLLDGRRENYGLGGALNEPGSELEAQGVSATIVWDISPSVTLSSITGYRWMDSHVGVDVDGSSVFYNENEIYNHQDQFSEELRLNGTAFGDRLSWQIGAYYAKENIEDQIFIHRLFCAPGGGFVAATCSPPALINQRIDGITTSWAVFTQETFHFTDALSLTAGVRYSEEEKDNTAVQPGVWGPIRLAPTWSSTTPRVSLEYAPSDDFLAYISYAEGFKSGGVNFVNLSPADFQTPFDPETTRAWEVGVKTDLFDERLRINTAVFHTIYQDMQFENFFGDESVCGTGVFFCSRTLNAAEAEIQGVELEATFVPTENLQLFANVAYIENEITEVDAALTALHAIDPTVLYFGTQLPTTPEWTYTVGGNYVLDLGESGEVTLRADYNFRSKFYFDTNNIDAASQDDIGLLNAGVSYTTADGHWRVSLDGSNLTDELYLINATGATYPSDGYAVGAYGAPRTFTLSLRRSFGE